MDDGYNMRPEWIPVRSLMNTACGEEWRVITDKEYNELIGENDD